MDLTAPGAKQMIASDPLPPSKTSKPALRSTLRSLTVRRLPRTSRASNLVPSPGWLANGLRHEHFERSRAPHGKAEAATRELRREKRVEYLGLHFERHAAFYAK